MQDAPRIALWVVTMKLYAPHMWLFLVAAVLALLGIVEHFSLSIPGLSPEHAIWLAFLGWLLLAIATALPGERQSS
jgi:hypothetical protein